MYVALVRLSSVVALTVPLAAYLALTIAVPEHQEVTVDYVSQPAGLATDDGPLPEDPTTPPAGDMEDMEGMDHSTPVEEEHGQHEGTSDDHPDEVAPTPDRPRVPVLSAFGGLNAVVLVSAAVLRRRKRHHEPQRRSDSDLPLTARLADRPRRIPR
ncbi:hypothetical protein [Sanguibacter antarcticus]|uniref:MYXO-CTERM domain-containing protein n=1 Tax=Sanguibacter antarcticus TaxID=372484 RepID=A0A2A9E1A5_9MICO|nr:hypothetical protein [Sanguibacter antarcticus]PFG32416.1 hypothetical protein ATL42_0249 [Sanguibacter antarcticus]